MIHNGEGCHSCLKEECIVQRIALLYDDENQSILFINQTAFRFCSSPPAIA